MPLDKSIKKVLVIGSGPIVIGQAAEFDYAGTQACRVLRENHIEIVLINSNPATIMTDNKMADAIYIEPLTLTTVKRIIEKECPDSILSGLGGQTSLNLCMQLAKCGFLDKMNVRLLGSSPETIEKSEDRMKFKQTMESIGKPVIPSVIALNVNTAIEFAVINGYPVIVRPAFTLGGSGGGIAYNEKELIETVNNGLLASPVNQVLVEKSVAGWKEIEFEVMRDKTGNVIAVCSMENFDPVGIHTGDSIVIAPCVTLADREYQMLRRAAFDIINAIGIEGGCNCQFALNPNSMEYAVIEVNPRVSRSSALASKATGYPIAKVATKIALGYTLDEIENLVTGKTFSAFEPALDYVAVKLPKWPFDKFVYAKRELGTQMKATGEVMAIADTFEDALLKAVRGAELGLKNLNLTKLKSLSDNQIHTMLYYATDERLFVIYEALIRGVTIDEIHSITKIDKWFLYKLSYINENTKNNSLIYKMVDTCGGEFEAKTPYFYSVSGNGENEVLPFIKKSNKKRIIVLGSGPIRIGQGIEFDYACVQCVNALKKLGYEVIVINNNPETVSTDFDTADRLYFEPLCIDDVLSIIEVEKPVGVIASFGGGTALKLTKKLYENGVNIIGTSFDSIDICEDRERFDKLLEQLNIKRPKGLCVFTTEQAIKAANSLGYPVLMRPSYVLGGQNMIIAFADSDILEYMNIILSQKQDNPVLIDKYLSGIEIETDAICDGTDILIPGIMEHIERTGIHSGDSIAVYPALHIDDDMLNRILYCTKRILCNLNIHGVVNIQYIIFNNELYVIEVNPRASRTVPYLSKVTGIPICDLATRASLGESVAGFGYGTGIYKVPPYTAVKVPVFSFEKLTDVDTHLGPEMKSTGEVLGIGKTLKEALYKGLVSAGYKMKNKGDVFITVRNSDKPEIAEIAKKFAILGFNLYATSGTAKVLEMDDLNVNIVNKIHEDALNNSLTILESGKLSYIISTSEKGRNPFDDDVIIRRKACIKGIPCLTAIDTANALADSLLSGYSEINTELVNINDMRVERLKLEFTKMQSCGNDYIYINCIEREINCPESLTAVLTDRHYGVGGDGIVLICKSNVADAKMRMFNADGSEGRMCGNAVRCVGKYLYDNNIVKKRHLRIETLSGIKSLQIHTTNNLVSSVKTDMGRAELNPVNIPVSLNGDNIVNYPIEINGVMYNITCVSMGNPHAVVFLNDMDDLNLKKIGPLFENNNIFPERVNTEFVKIIDNYTLKMRVWERGNGETYACGTGACAVVVAAVLNNYCNKGDDIRVILKGGELLINYTDDVVYMTGDCIKVYEGVVEI